MDGNGNYVAGADWFLEGQWDAQIDEIDDEGQRLLAHLLRGVGSPEEEHEQHGVERLGQEHFARIVVARMDVDGQPERRPQRRRRVPHELATLSHAKSFNSIQLY